MKDRIKEIASAIPKSKVFADIGCDHGYIANEVIKSGKCERAIISDISAKSLKKAETLLKDYMAKGIVISVVSDGFNSLPPCDTAVIAGMGGEEIAGILERAKYLPFNLVLQPMRNFEKIRKVALKSGYKFVKDYIFKSGDKFYLLISLVKGEDNLTEDELQFGRTNLLEHGEDFVLYLKEELTKLESYTERENISDTAREEITVKMQRLKNLLKEV